MRIAIVTDFYYPSLGGITEHVDGQARGLQARGHEVTVVTGRILQTPRVQDDAMPVPEPTFEIVRLGAAVPLYVPRWGNNAQTLHTMWPWLGRQRQGPPRLSAVDRLLRREPRWPGTD